MSDNDLKCRVAVDLESIENSYLDRILKILSRSDYFIGDGGILFSQYFKAEKSKKPQFYHNCNSQKNAYPEGFRKKKILSGRYRCSIGENGDDEHGCNSQYGLSY